MIIKWYNRDEFSDVDMRQAKAVADRLQGKKKESPDGVTLEQLQQTYSKVKFPSLIPNQMVVSPSQYLFLRAEAKSKGWVKTRDGRDICPGCVEACQFKK